MQKHNIILPGGWAKQMSFFGFQVFDTLIGDFSLLKKWADEHFISTKNLSQLDLIIKQVDFYKPDIVFIYAGAFFSVNKEARTKIKDFSKRNNIIFTGFWGDELPINSSYDSDFSDLDLIFTSSNFYTEKLKYSRTKVVTLGNCFDQSIEFYPLAKTNDFIFCGTTGYGYPDHIKRYENLIDLMTMTNLNIWSNESSRPLSLRDIFRIRLMKILKTLNIKVLRKLCDSTNCIPLIHNILELSIKSVDFNVDPEKLIINPNYENGQYFLDKKPIRKIFKNRVFEPFIDGQKYLSHLANSKIVLNIHRDEMADVGNIRCFEVTGVGSCLVTDARPGLTDFFDIENDIVTFSTVEECVKKVKFLLDNPAELQRISKNGQKKTLNNHTLHHRCQTISSELRQLAI